MTPKPILILAAASAALLGVGLAPTALASEINYGAYTVGTYVDADEVVQNQVFGASTIIAPNTMASYVTCVDCSFDPAQLPTPTHWYQRENLPTSAAAQAHANWGLAEVRSFKGSGTSGDLGLPGAGRYSYFASADAYWQEDLIYLAPTPGVVTFEVRMHASWNDHGRVAAYGGIPFDFGDGQDGLDGQQYDNCPLSGDFRGCTGRAGAGSYTYLPGNDADNSSGIVDRLVRFSAIVRPSNDPFDDENPTPVGPTPFLIGLSAASHYNGSEVDGFGTMSLERVILQPGASISFSSGTAYLVTTVPEPASVALWLAGLMGIAGFVRRRRTLQR